MADNSSLNFVREALVIGGGDSQGTSFNFYRSGFKLGGSGGSTPTYKDIVLSGNGSLTLTNAKANGLNYLKLFGGTELLPSTYLDTVTLSGGCEQESVLPEGYTELESIKSDGACYIDTGIKGNMGVDGEVEFAVWDCTVVNWIIGARVNASTNSRFGINTYPDGQENLFGFALGITTNLAYKYVYNQSRYKATFQTSNAPYTCEIANKGTISTNNTQDTDLNLFLCANNVGGTPEYAGHQPISIYRCKLLVGGELAKNFIPAKRNSDNALGMYDTVSGTFHEKQGTGSFTAGAEVVPTPNTPMDIVSNNGVIKYSANMANVNEQTALVGYYISAQGVVTADSNNWIYQDYIPVKPNTTYTLTMSAPVYYVTISEYSTTDDSGFIIRNAGSSGGNTSLTITTGSTTNFVRFGTNIDRSVVTIEKVLAINWMLNKGDSLPYAPYSPNSVYADGTVETVTDSNQLTATAQMLLSVGDYKDTQEVLSGNVTRNIGILILDGTESWQVASGTGFRQFYSSATQGVIANSVSLISNIAPYGCTASTRADYDFGCYSGGTGNLCFQMVGSSTLNTTTDWTNYLADQYNAGSPVVVVYPLATATTETVTGQFLSKSPVTQTAGSISNLPIAITESSHTTPTPQQPLPINCNNGVLGIDSQGNITVTGTTETVNIHTKNLFNGIVEQGGLGDSSGAETSSSVRIRSTSVSAKPNTQYNLSWATNSEMAVNIRNAHFYDASNIWISRVNATTFTTPPNTAFVRFVWQHSNPTVDIIPSDISNVQLELGSTATPL